MIARLLSRFSGVSEARIRAAFAGLTREAANGSPAVLGIIALQLATLLCLLIFGMLSA